MCIYVWCWWYSMLATEVALSYQGCFPHECISFILYIILLVYCMHYCPAGTISVIVCCMSVESHSRARETVIVGPITTSFCMCRDQKASRGKKRRESCPLTIWVGVWGSVVSSHGGVWRSSGRKWILCYLRSERSHLEHPFQLFWSDGGAPQTLQGLGKLSPIPPPFQWACCVVCL